MPETGKKFKLNLKDETGEQCLLEITQEKDGNLCIGKNGGKANKYIRAGRPQRNYAATTAATAPQTAFFRKDTVHIRGFLDGYSPKLGFTTVLIYTDNHITNEGTPAVVTIHPDGRFESDFVVNYPGVHHLSMGNNWMTFYISTGRDTDALYQLGGPSGLSTPEETETYVDRNSVHGTFKQHKSGTDAL